jgi:hypothetical protein
MKPGLYDLSWPEYFKLDALSRSVLERMRRTAAHAYEYETRPHDDTTEAKTTGDAAHAALLEPDRWAQQYVVAPKVDKRTKKGKQEYADWEASLAPDSIVLSPSEYKTAKGIHKAVWANPDIAALVGGEGQNEKTVVWNDPGTSLLCKGRLDRITTSEGWTVVIDIKTTRNAEPWAFAGDAAHFGYHRQAAWYLRGLRILDERKRRFLIIAIEKEPPYLSVIYRLDPETVMKAEDDLQALVYRYAECKERGVWPGYPRGVQSLGLPKWATGGEE